MRVNPFLMPLLVVGALLGTVFTAQALGQWSVSGRAAMNLEQFAPADIKGWMTLDQVMAGLSISQPELYALMDIPAEIAPETALKDLEQSVPGFEVSVLRERLAAWQSGGPPSGGLPSATEQPAPASAATATPTLAPTPLSAGHAPQGDGAGAGPTPLPAGQALPADQIKGRMSLAEISAQCAVPLDQLLAALGLPAHTDPATRVRDLISQGLVSDTAAVQAAVAARQSP